MKMDNTALIMNVRALRRILDRGDDVTAEIAGTVAEINADADHSDSWKAQRLEKARAVKNGELRKLGREALPLIEMIDQQINSRANGFDFRDPDFQMALSTISTYGNNLPHEVMTSIVNSMRGDVTALKAVKSALKQYNIGTEYADQMISPLDSLGVNEAGEVSEFAAYATSDLATENEWRAGGVRRMLDNYEKAIGFDATNNPVLARLDSFINDPNTRPDMKHRAEVWKKSYAEDLNNDDERAMSMTTNRLDAWENGKAAPPQGVL